MTGDLLSDAERRKLSGADTQTARYVGQDKTRKVVIGGHRAAGAPADLLGWVLLRPPAGEDEARELARAARAPKLVAPASPTRAAAAAAPVESSAQAQAAPLPAVLDSLARGIAALRPQDRGRVASLADDIARAEPPERRRRLIEQLERRLRQVFGKRRKNEIAQIIAKLRGSAN